MIFDLFVNGFHVNVKLRPVVETLSTLDAQADFLPNCLVHCENVRLQSIFASSEEVAVWKVAGEFFSKVLWNVPLDVPVNLCLEVTGIVAVVAEEPLDLIVDHLLMFGEIFDEDPACWTLLPFLKLSFVASSFSVGRKTLVKLFAVNFQTTWPRRLEFTFVARICFHR